MHNKTLTTHEIADKLQAHGVKASLQRLRIYGYLIQSPVHPTVDMIYTALVEEMPTLSKTTVYNTLKLLTEKGLVNTLTIEGNENRYDAELGDHGHFKCKQCGALFDFSLEDHSVVIHELDGFKTEDRHVYFQGICKACLEKSQQKKSHFNGGRGND